MHYKNLIRTIFLIYVNIKTISCQIDINCDVNWPDYINCDTGEYFNIADEFRTISSVQPNDQKNFTRFQTYYLQTTYVPENVFFDITFEEIDFYQTDVMYFIDRNAFRGTFNITRRLLFSQTFNLRTVPPGTDLYAAISSLVNLESVTICLATDYVHVIPENAFSSLNGPLNSLEEIIFRGDFNISNIANNAFAAIPNLKTWFIFSSIPIEYISSQAFDFTQQSVDRLEIHLNGSSLNESSFGDNVFSGSQRPLFVDLDNNNIVNFRENTFSAFFNASPLNNISIANNPVDCDNSDIGWLLNRYHDLENRLLNAQCSNGSLLWDLIGTTPTPTPPPSTTSPNPSYCTVNWPQSIVCNTNQNFDIRDEFQRISNSLPANQKAFNQLLIYYVPIQELVENAFFDITFNEIDLHEMQNMTAVNTNAFNGTANTTTKLLLSETNTLLNSPPNDDLYGAISAIVSLQSVTIDLAADVSHVIPENAFRVVSAPQTELQEIVFRGDFSISQISNNAFAAIPNLRTWIQINNIPVQYVARQAFDFSEPSTDRLEIHLQGCGLNESSFDNDVFSGSRRPLYVNLNDNQIRYLNESTFTAFFDANAGNNLTIADNPLECSDLDPFEWLFIQRPQLESRLLSALCSDGTPLWNYTSTPSPTTTTPMATTTTVSPTPPSSSTPRTTTPTGIDLPHKNQTLSTYEIVAIIGFCCAVILILILLYYNRKSLKNLCKCENCIVVQNIIAPNNGTDLSDNGRQSVMNLNSHNIMENETDIRFQLNPNVYKMKKIPRGLCLIINNERFARHSQRFGSEVDAKRLREIFEKLHFRVELYIDLTCAHMIDVINRAKKSNYNKSGDAFVLIILSHGFEGGLIYGTDSYYNGVSVDRDIVVQFNDRNCPALIGKPKMFFFNTCRGKIIDRGANVSIDYSLEVERIAEAIDFEAEESVEIDNNSIRASWQDMVIASSSVERYASARDKVNGAWFANALIIQLEKCARNQDLHTILNNVTKDVMSREGTDSSGERMKQTPSIEYRGFTKKLYFNP